jgi:protein gp37
MAKTTGIQWAGATWNPWYGCRKVSTGCANCYAERWAKRTGNKFYPPMKSKYTFDAPLSWKTPKLVFVCSLGDFFFDGRETGEKYYAISYWRYLAFNTMRQANQHTYLILTKRPENISRMLPPDWGAGWPNVWLGVTVESADYVIRAEELARIQVYENQRFISYEPAIGPLGNKHMYSPVEYLLSDGKFRWFIAGGESGPGARPARSQWFEAMREECSIARVPFFLKQLGGTRKIDGAFGGYTLPDGSRPREVPQSLSGFFTESRGEV